MKTFSKKHLHSLAYSSSAIDITNWNSDQLRRLHNAHSLSPVGATYNSIGISGVILKDINTNTFYVITDRTPALFTMI